MAHFANHAVSCISHVLPAEQEIEQYFTEPSLPEEAEEESFDYAIPLEQEHLEALARYEELLSAAETPSGSRVQEICAFLQEVSELGYPFGFWYQCSQSAVDRDLALAFILYMMSNQAISPHESIHTLFSAALEAVNGILEFEPEAFQLVMVAVDASKERLVAYVPPQRQVMAEALWDNYLEMIDRGDERMDQQLIAIENVYFKLISNN